MSFYLIYLPKIPRKNPLKFNLLKFTPHFLAFSTLFGRILGPGPDSFVRHHPGGSRLVTCFLMKWMKLVHTKFLSRRAVKYHSKQQQKYAKNTDSENLQWLSWDSEGKGFQIATVLLNPLENFGSKRSILLISKKFFGGVGGRFLGVCWHLVVAFFPGLVMCHSIHFLQSWSQETPKPKVDESAPLQMLVWKLKKDSNEQNEQQNHLASWKARKFQCVNISFLRYFVVEVGKTKIEVPSLCWIFVGIFTPFWVLFLFEGKMCPTLSPK